MYGIILYTQMMNTKTQRWWDVPAALFLLGALFSAAVRLQVTNWTEHLGRIEFVVILGVIFGLALGKSIFSGRVTFWLGLAYSVFVIPWHLGLLMPQGDWTFRLNYLYARLFWATSDFIHNQPVRDPILFLSTMTILYWFASLLASYRLVRRANPWLPLLSLGGMILVIEYTSELYRYARISGSIYSFLYLLFSLILMGRLYFLRSRKDWEQRGGTIELEVGYDLGRGVIISALVLALLAWNTPFLLNVFSSGNPAQERITRSWQVFKDRVSKAANSLRSPAPLVVEGYGNNMFLGTGGTLGDNEVFTVQLDGVKSRPSGRFYWTARNYDTYLNGQWVTSISGSQDIGPGESQLTYPEWDLRKSVQFTFSSNIPLLQTLYHPSEPLGISRDSKAVLSVDENGEADLNAIVMDPPLKAGETYSVLARIAQPTVSAMRNDTGDYPDWVTSRYLQLPDNFSPRIADLAQQVAGSEQTNYDKALAVTQYLRRAITYSESVPEAPRNQDPIEWFLFDHRSGFCNYYASAEVLMLRSLGIPARLVVGYAEGTWDPEKDLFSVIAKDSHAWPEVYFSTLGWIAFEPTVSQPLMSFPAGEGADRNSFPDANVQEPPSEEDYLNNAPSSGDPNQDILDFYRNQGAGVDQGASISPWTIALLVFLVLAGVLVFLEWRRRKIMSLPFPTWVEKSLDERGFRTPDWLRIWSRRSLRTPMENLFSNVGLMLRIWGQKLDPSQTPSEQVNLLVTVVPGVKDYADALLEEYQRALYSPYPANLYRARKAVEDLRSVGLRNWALRLVGIEA